jgi:phytoene dehydrogenase-like protein
MTRQVDAVVIGSGINGLIVAARLARAGWAVEMLERNAVAGGAIATEELTLPGFRHDTFSASHPLFQASPAYAELGDELADNGLAYRNAERETTATVSGDGAVTLLYRDPEETAAALRPDDRERYLREIGTLAGRMPQIGALLATELRSAAAVAGAVRVARAVGRRQLIPFVADLLASLRSWLARFDGPELERLLAPWVLHTGLSPDGAGGGFATLATAGALHGFGIPIVEGGSSRFVDAFVALITAHGGVVRTGCEVDRIITRGGRAVGVRTAGEEEIGARRAVIANVTTRLLYERLLERDSVPPAVLEEARRFRYSARAGMQLHFALSEPPRWRDERLASVPLVHVADGLDGVALACAQAAAGRVPERPTIACGQPAVLDPSRAPGGASVLWIQLQEVPDAPRGGWTDELVDSFTERIVARLSEHIANLPEAIVGRAALSPVELERRNPNLVRGDIYSGVAELSQSYLWRPLPSFGSHATPVDGLYQCGASTFPGAGLGGGSGTIVADTLLATRRPRALMRPRLNAKTSGGRRL